VQVCPASSCVTGPFGPKAFARPAPCEPLLQHPAPQLTDNLSAVYRAICAKSARCGTSVQHSPDHLFVRPRPAGRDPPGDVADVGANRTTGVLASTHAPAARLGACSAVFVHFGVLLALVSRMSRMHRVSNFTLSWARQAAAQDAQVCEQE
jgi:hypothetical protein